MVLSARPRGEIKFLKTQFLARVGNQLIRSDLLLVKTRENNSDTQCQTGSRARKVRGRLHIWVWRWRGWGAGNDITVSEVGRKWEEMREKDLVSGTAVEQENHRHRG